MLHEQSKLKAQPLASAPAALPGAGFSGRSFGQSPYSLSQQQQQEKEKLDVDLEEDSILNYGTTRSLTALQSIASAPTPRAQVQSSSTNISHLNSASVHSLPMTTNAPYRQVKGASTNVTVAPMDSVMSSFAQATLQERPSGLLRGPPVVDQEVNINNSYYKKKARYEKKTNLEMSIDSVLDLEAEEKLGTLLKKYILKKCSLNEYCRKQDFDGTALDGLNRLFFVQSLQAVEHYAASVSERIQKKPAYLMGILRGQESHWDNSRAAAQLEGGSVQLLNLPGRVLYQIGVNCLEGNCLPSDFTPEVLLSLHSLTVKYTLRALNAFNSNKRIVAGCRGGVVNRPRFFQRLIENVIQQNPLVYETESQALENLASVEYDNLSNSASSNVSQKQVTVKFSPEVVSINEHLKDSNGNGALQEGEDFSAAEGEESQLNSQGYNLGSISNVSSLLTASVSNSAVPGTGDKFNNQANTNAALEPTKIRKPMSQSEPVLAGLSSVSPRSTKSFFSMLGSHTSPDSVLELMNSNSTNSSLSNSNVYVNKGVFLANATATNQVLKNKEADPTKGYDSLNVEEKNALLESRVSQLEAELMERLHSEQRAQKELDVMKSQLGFLQGEYDKLRNTMNEVIGGIKEQIVHGVHSTFNNLNMCPRNQP